MRYHARSPLHAQSPNFPIAVSVQRSSPTCSLSLASVSALSKAAHNTTRSDAMAVDTPPTVSVTVSPPAKIPFPKRPHSLLRSTTPRVLYAEDSKSSIAQDLDEPQDLDPPRKRTRTSALSTSTRIRSCRPTFTTARAPCPSTDSVSPLLINPLPDSLSIIIPPTYQRPIQPNLTPSNPEPVDSPSQVSISLSSDSSANPSSHPLRVPSNHGPPRHFRRAATAELRTLLCLYRTLVYGLEIKYPDRPGKLNANQEHSSVSDTQASCRVTAKSYFDVHDALLAQHLKTYLLANGTDIHLLVVDVEGIASEGLRDGNPVSCDDDMKMDLEDASKVLSPHYNPFLHPHLHLSTTRSVLSYQQLVASLIMRRRLFPGRLQGRSLSKLSKQRRKLSTLAECVSLD